MLKKTILHMFRECPKVKDFWLEAKGWLHKYFEHCTNITFPKNWLFFFYIFFSLRASSVTDRITDLYILIAKYIFTSKLQGTTPHLNAFVQNMKNRFKLKNIIT